MKKAAKLYEDLYGKIGNAKWLILLWTKFFPYQKYTIKNLWK